MEHPARSEPLTELREAIAKVRHARDELEADRVQAVRRAGETLGAFFAERAIEVRSRAERLLGLGVPPSLRNLCGTWDLEVPLNRILGWLFDPAGSHGADAAPLLHLVRSLNLGAMAADLRNGARASVYAESSPDPSRWWRQPDLVVETPRAVLLLENKVLSPESGPEQYRDYLEMVQEMAAGRAWQAVLLTRQGKTVPEGWTRVLLHAELADLLSPLGESCELSAWARILVALITTDLRYNDLSARVGDARRLLDRSRDGNLQPLDVRRLSLLLDGIPDAVPWELR